jgi:hypothetical protein
VVVIGGTDIHKRDKITPRFVPDVNVGILSVAGATIRAMGGAFIGSEA